MTSATGAGRKNTQRQPISVSRPPNTSPSEKPRRTGRGEDRRAPCCARAPRRSVVVMIDSAGGRGERGADALDEAGRDQQGAVVREPAQERGDDEDGERDQEDAPPSEQIGRAASEQQEAAVAEHVARSRPTAGSSWTCGGSVRIDGSATPIIDTSSASRKSAPQRTSKVPQASLVSLSVHGAIVRRSLTVLWIWTLEPPIRYCSIRTVHSCSMSVK